jgi:23S rRNA pseudouridine1911/1915/1917 synthase
MGDAVYGAPRRVTAPRQMLHAAVLGFVHPSSGARMRVESPLPRDFQDLLQRLRRERAL